MAFVERRNALRAAPEQLGGGKKHQRVLAALNERATMDTLRQAGALCANDAKSLCDQIARDMAVLAIQRLGVAAAPACSTFETLQGAKRVASAAFWSFG